MPSPSVGEDSLPRWRAPLAMRRVCARDRPHDHATQETSHLGRQLPAGGRRRQADVLCMSRLVTVSVTVLLCGAFTASASAVNLSDVFQGVGRGVTRHQCEERCRMWGGSWVDCHAVCAPAPRPVPPERVDYLCIGDCQRDLGYGFYLCKRLCGD